MANYENDFETKKSSAEIEREIEAQRSRVSSTIDEIQEQLSPGQLIDQFMSMTKSSGGDFARNLGKSITGNPLPVALLGASLVWLISSQGQQARPAAKPYRQPSYAGSGSDAYPDLYAGYRGDKPSPLDAAKSAVSGVAESIAGIAGKVQDAAGQVGGSIGHAMQDAGDTAAYVQESVGQMAGQVGRAAHDLRDQAMRYGGNVAHMLEDQPLVAGALAFAAGAALGALVPHTSQEDEIMGAAADQVKSAVKDAAEPILEEGQHLLDEGKSKFEDARATLESGIADVQDSVGKALGGKDQLTN